MCCIQSQKMHSDQKTLMFIDVPVANDGTQIQIMFGNIFVSIM